MKSSKCVNGQAIREAQQWTSISTLIHEIFGEVIISIRPDLTQDCEYEASYYNSSPGPSIDPRGVSCIISKSEEARAIYIPEAKR
jgi:hypothetical protein